MDFYARHRDALNFGHWEFGFSEASCAWARVTYGDECVVIVSLAESYYEATDLPGSDLQVEVLNLSAHEIWTDDDAEVFQCDGTALETDEFGEVPPIPLGGRASFFLAAGEEDDAYEEACVEFGEPEEDLDGNSGL